MSAPKTPTASISPAVFGRLRESLDSLKVVVVNQERGEEPSKQLDAKAVKKWASKARKSVGKNIRKVYDQLPENVSGGVDLEAAKDIPKSSDGAESSEPSSKSWTSRAKEASESVAQAAQKVKEEGFAKASQAAEKVREEGLASAAKGVGSQVKKGIGRASESTVNAGVKVQEKTKLITEKAGSKAIEAKAVAAKGLTVVSSTAEGIVGTAKDRLSHTGENLQSLSLATMSPKKLAQAGVVFFIGATMVSMSFAFLPMVAVSPMAFAGLTTAGSLCIMASIAILRGFEKFLKSITKKKKLPFSAMYTTGLLGTLFATVVKRSLILTAVFGILQALGLLYFLEIGRAHV